MRLFFFAPLLSFFFFFASPPPLLAASFTSCEDSFGIVVRSLSCPSGFQPLTSGIVLSDDESCCVLPNKANICSLPQNKIDASFCKTDCSGSNIAVVDAGCGCTSGSLCISSTAQSTIASLVSNAAANPNPQLLPNGQRQSNVVNYYNPLQWTTPEGLVSGVLGALRNIIVVLALVFLIIGAVLYITSSGNESRIRKAKSAILAAMIGLAIGIAAPSFLKEIAAVLGWSTTESELTRAGVLTLSQIALNTLNFLLALVGVLSIIMLVIGGMTYLFSAGDENQAETAKKIVKFSIIGIAVALASLVIVSQIAALFI